MQELDAILNSVAEADVRRYLEEAQRCFSARASNAAVVMAWCGVILYFRRVVERFGFDFLAYQLWAIDISQEERLEDAFNNWKCPIVEQRWQRVNDRHLLEACKRMGLQVPERVQVDFRIKRNALAHPDMEFVTPEEALELVRSGQGVYSQHVKNERLTDIDGFFAYAKQTTDGAAVKQVVDHLNVTDDRTLQYAHRALDAFTKDEKTSQEGLVAFWGGLWDRFDERQKESLWRHIEQELQVVLDDPDSLRTPEDMAQFIIWPDPRAEDRGRDRIAGMYVVWLEGRVSNNEFINADMGLARDLRLLLPDHWQERLQRVLEEMIK